EGGWDDWAGLDVKGKIALVLRRGPRSGEAAGRYGEGRGRERISFVAKVNAAFQHGAAALIVVNDPVGSASGPERDRLMSYRGLGGEGVAASLPAVNITAALGSSLFQSMGLDLEAVQ